MASKYKESLEDNNRSSKTSTTGDCFPVSGYMQSLYSENHIKREKRIDSNHVESADLNWSVINRWGRCEL